MRASDDLGVDGGHDKGPGPRLKIIIPGDAGLIRTIQAFIKPRRIERIGVHDALSDRGVLRGLFGDIHQTGDCAAADASGRATHSATDAIGVVPVAFFEVLLQKID